LTTTGTEPSSDAEEKGIAKIEELVAHLERTFPNMPDGVGMYLVAVIVVRDEDNNQTQMVARELPCGVTDEEIDEIRRGILRDVAAQTEV
jgi:hypothetical protein